MRAKCQEKNDDEVEKVATISPDLNRPLVLFDHKT
jgi:hypothetical protein